MTGAIILCGLLALPFVVSLGVRRVQRRRLREFAEARGLERDGSTFRGEVDGLQVTLRVAGAVRFAARVPGCARGEVGPMIGIVDDAYEAGDAAFNGDFVVTTVELRAQLDAAAKAAIREHVVNRLTIVDGWTQLDEALQADNATLSAALARVVGAAQALAKTPLGDDQSLSAHLGERALDPSPAVAEWAIDTLLGQRAPDPSIVRRVLAESTLPSVRIRAAACLGAEAVDAVLPYAEAGPCRAEALAWFGRFRAEDPALLGRLVSAALADQIDPVVCARVFDFCHRAHGDWTKPDEAEIPALLGWAALEGWLEPAVARGAWRSMLDADDVHAVKAAELLGHDGTPDDVAALHARLQTKPGRSLRVALQGAIARLSEGRSGELSVAAGQGGELALDPET